MSDDPLTSGDRAVLVRLLKRTIDASRFPLSDETREYRAVLEKLAPPREKKPPPPLPTGKSGYIESRKRQRRNRVLPG